MKELIKKITKRDVLVGISCLLLGVIVMLLCYPKRIAKLKNGEEVVITLNKTNITADDIYKGLKEKYAITQIFESVDKSILEKKYKLTDEDIKKIEENANYYFETYESNYGMSKEEFLSNNNFDSEKDFINYLKLDYMRNLYYEEYMEKQVSKEDINNYYEKNVFAPFSVEHILVKITETVDNETAKAKASEILDKLNSGTSWDEIKNTYKDQITVENFDVEFDSQFEESFTNAAVKLTDGSHSSLVETSYGYHIINRISTKEKPELKAIKDRIVTVLVNNLKQKEEYDYQKVLDKMRSEAKMKIKDTELKKAYKKYLDSLE